MVKRKVAINIDEWLLNGTTDPETSYPTATTSADRRIEPNYAPSGVVQSAVTGEQVAGPLATSGRVVQSAVTGGHVAGPLATSGRVAQSTVTGAQVVEPVVTSEQVAPSTGPGGRVPTVVADRSNQQEENSEWFWLILEQACYERW